MRKMLITIFNDTDEDNSHSLETAIASLSGINSLKYKPAVYNHEIGSEIVKMFEEIALIPTFFFVDPWGNKGLSNPLVKAHMDALFGVERADDLRKRLESLTPKDKELTIVEELAEALKEMGGKHVLPFGFRNDKGNRTTHHLIFVSKNAIGYKIMKEIMAGESSKSEQGVASFEYSPADVRQPLLFEMARPLDDLEQLLLTKFAGRTVTYEQAYQEHNVGTPYIEKNYKDAFRKLEAKGKITTITPADQRKKYKGELTINNILFTFPT